ncbi:MAG: hypothetical protein M3Y56_00525, partial [Armatimonadota bacterium]|nr:hypothetical protein [Armatimonadota bacterium]
MSLKLIKSKKTANEGRGHAGDCPRRVLPRSPQPLFGQRFFIPRETARACTLAGPARSVPNIDLSPGQTQHGGNEGRTAMNDRASHTKPGEPGWTSPHKFNLIYEVLYG